MESISDLEQSIAGFVLGELSPQAEAGLRSRLAQDPVARHLEAQMRRRSAGCGPGRNSTPRYHGRRFLQLRSVGRNGSGRRLESRQPLRPWLP